MPLVLSGSTGIVEGNIADSAITTNKIANGAVAASDLDTSIKTIKATYSQEFKPVLSISGSFNNFSQLYTVGQITLTPQSLTSKLLVTFNCGWTKTTSPVGVDWQLIVNGSAVSGLDNTSRFGMRYEGHRRAVVSTGYFNTSGSKLYYPNTTSQIQIGIGIIIYDENSSFTIGVAHNDYPLTLHIIEF